MHPADEGMYILEGHCTFQAGGETAKAGPGTFVSIPRDTEHSFVVDVAHTRLLNFYTPDHESRGSSGRAQGARAGSNPHAAALDGGRDVA